MTEPHKSTAHFGMAQTAAKALRSIAGRKPAPNRPDCIQTAMQDVSSDPAFHSPWLEEDMSAMMDDDSAERDREFEQRECDAEWALQRDHGC